MNQSKAQLTLVAEIQAHINCFDCNSSPSNLLARISKSYVRLCIGISYRLEVPPSGLFLKALYIARI